MHIGILVSGVYVSSILNKILSNYSTELLDVVIRKLVSFMQDKNYMEHLSLNNKSMPFLGKW